MKDEIVEVKVRSGVYMDKNGDLIHIELGMIDGCPAVKVTGQSEGGETDRIVEIGSPDTIHLCRLIEACEYLGEL